MEMVLYPCGLPSTPYDYRLVMRETSNKSRRISFTYGISKEKERKKMTSDYLWSQKSLRAARKESLLAQKAREG